MPKPKSVPEKTWPHQLGTAQKEMLKITSRPAVILIGAVQLAAQQKKTAVPNCCTAVSPASLLVLFSGSGVKPALPLPAIAGKAPPAIEVARSAIGLDPANAVRRQQARTTHVVLHASRAVAAHISAGCLELPETACGCDKIVLAWRLRRYRRPVIATVIAPLDRAADGIKRNDPGDDCSGVFTIGTRRARRRGDTAQGKGKGQNRGHRSLRQKSSHGILQGLFMRVRFPHGETRWTKAELAGGVAQ